jgi:hypothetical protein
MLQGESRASATGMPLFPFDCNSPLSTRNFLCRPCAPTMHRPRLRCGRIIPTTGRSSRWQGGSQKRQACRSVKRGGNGVGLRCGGIGATPCWAGKPPSSSSLLDLDPLPGFRPRIPPVSSISTACQRLRFREKFFPKRVYEILPTGPRCCLFLKRLREFKACEAR